MNSLAPLNPQYEVRHVGGGLMGVWNRLWECYVTIPQLGKAASMQAAEVRCHALNNHVHGNRREG